VKTFLLLCATAAIVGSCDVIEGDPTERPDGNNGGTGVPRTVLLEDFTGQLCGNCPAAATTAKEIEDAYDGRVITVAVHVGTLASPAPPDYPHEFRTPHGNEFDNTFNASREGIPKGMVNRTRPTGQFLLGRGQWAQVVAQQLQTSAAISLDGTATYDSSARTITVTADIEYETAGTPDYHVAAMLVEDGIIGSQLDYSRSPSRIQGYVFNHVFRTGLNGAWGEQLSSTAVANGTTVSRTITYAVPDGVSWNMENCHVVLYVHRHTTTREVLQAKKLSLATTR
jgi:hypothetical protein